MKAWQPILGVVSCAAILAFTPSFAEEGKKECCAPQVKTSAQFDQIKGLVGRWEGTDSMTPEEKGVVEYALTAGGTALVEKIFPGTPKEMISVYHDRNGRLAMTHYCLLGNQPNLSLKNAEPNKLVFEMSGKSGIRDSKEPHMHALTLTWKDADHIVQEWVGYENGKRKNATTFKLARVK